MGVVGVVILRMDVGAKGREEWAHLNTGEKGVSGVSCLFFLVGYTYPDGYDSWTHCVVRPDIPLLNVLVCLVC